jgi:hypothetical protein
MQATFWELPSFARRRGHYLNDNEYRALQIALMRNPEQGALVPGSGGMRKLRYGDASRGKGKRGGLRIIYFWRESAAQFWLFTIYGKDEMVDLTATQLQVLRIRLQQELQARSHEKC